MGASSPPHPVDCNVDFDTSNCAGKTAIVTGGANGLGEAYARALASAGYDPGSEVVRVDSLTKKSFSAIVCIADLDAELGERLASELPKAKFIQCNVTHWEDQTRLFREAAQFSPSGKVHFVVANAGIAGKDDVFKFDDNGAEPTEPTLNIIDVNLRGALYTVKLALHYFVQQNGTTPHPSQQDSCLILIGSGAAYFDVPRSVQYCSTKWGMRGIMHAMRGVAYHCGSRVNMISPWYVRTKILPKQTFERVEKTGVKFATTEDAGQCLLRILSDSTINGRCLFIAARKWAPRGYVDLDLDEYLGNPLLEEIQADQVKSSPAELGLFP